MLSVTVRLLHGTIRAGSPDDTGLSGADTAGEWPPSPARLFSALVAGDGTGARCTETSGAELTWLESLPPPLIFASPTEAVRIAPLLSRFVVVDKTAEHAVQDYPARSNRKVHPGVRIAPRDDRIVYLWPRAQPTAAQLSAIGYRAARVGYLGCSDSPVQLSVSDVAQRPFGEPWQPDVRGDVVLPVPYPGFLAALDQAYDAWSTGEAMRRSWITTRRAFYRAPSSAAPVTRSSRVVIWLRFGRSTSGRNLLTVTETLRAALLDHLDRLAGGAGVPPVIHGHRPNGELGEQADFLALPEVGHRHATGRILGAAVSLPASTTPDTVQLVRTALAQLAAERLAYPGRFDVSLSVHAGEQRPWTTHPRRWVGPARQWSSVSPVVHERWTKKVPTLEDVATWCAHAGLPEPRTMTLSRRPLLAGALDLPPALVFRADRERRPYSHMAMEFVEPVEGPVVLGRGRQFGMGLFAPQSSGLDGANGQRRD